MTAHPDHPPSASAAGAVSNQGPGPAPGDDPAVERLAAEMAERWRKGERPRAEEFLDRHPVLWNQPEAAADLIYEEFCLRQELGEEDPAAV